MIRLQKWAGMLTYVSKYFLPPGASQEQVNMCCLLPGQLTVRGGMGKVKSRTAGGNGEYPVLDAEGTILEMYGYGIGDESTDQIIALVKKADGTAEIKGLR